MSVRILGMTFNELQHWLVDELDQKPFRAAQLAAFQKGPILQ